MKLRDLGAVNEQEQQDYAKFLDQLSQFNADRNFALQGWQSNFGLLQDQLSALQGQDAVNYGREQDKINLELQRSETERQAAVNQVAAILQAGGTPSGELLDKAGLTTEYAQGVNAGWQRENAVKQVADILAAGGLPSDELLAQAGLTTEYAQGVHGEFQRKEEENQRALAQAQVDAILQAGGTPSQEMIAASGYSNEYVQALAAAYQRQQAQAAAAKKSGTATATPNKTATDATGAITAFNGGDHSDAIIKKLLDAGYTQAQIEAAGYKGTYFSKGGGAGTNPNGAAGTSGKGTSYNSIWHRARTMYDQGRSEKEIMAYLDQFGEKQLTDEGLDYIMSSLNLGGYRTGGK